MIIGQASHQKQVKDERRKRKEMRQREHLNTKFSQRVQFQIRQRKKKKHNNKGGAISINV